jgi:hypothetical protein
MIGDVFGSKTLMKIAGRVNLASEKLATLFNPVSRAILGGTGKYMGVRGELTSTRNADGTYKQEFTLLK